MKSLTIAALALLVAGNASAYNPFSEVNEYSTDFSERAAKAPQGDQATLNNIGRNIENGAWVESLTIESTQSTFDNVPFERWRVGVPKLVRHVQQERSWHYNLPTECVYPNGYETVIYDVTNPPHFMAIGEIVSDHTCTNVAEVVTNGKSSLRFDSLAAWAAHWERMNNAVRQIPSSVGSAWDSVTRWCGRNPIAIILLLAVGAFAGMRIRRKRKNIAS
ncbi:hypothetical protein L2X67_17070 [Enterobacter ludwigii]|nr:hypothetical protein [Enterobacter ludwigii]